MKSKILLSFVISCSSATISIAQISPGKILLGGGMGYSSNKNTQLLSNPSSDSRSLYAHVQVGKFLRQNAAAELKACSKKNGFDLSEYSSVQLCY